MGRQWGGGISRHVVVYCYLVILVSCYCARPSLLASLSDAICTFLFYHTHITPLSHLSSHTLSSLLSHTYLLSLLLFSPLSSFLSLLSSLLPTLFSLLSHLSSLLYRPSPHTSLTSQHSPLTTYLSPLLSSPLLPLQAEHNNELIAYIEKEANWRFPPGFAKDMPSARLTIDPVFATQR